MMWLLARRRSLYLEIPTWSYSCKISSKFWGFFKTLYKIVWTFVYNEIHYKGEKMRDY